MKQRSNKLPQAGIVEKVLRMVEARDTGKAQYKAADQLLEELLPHLKVGESLDLGNGETATLTDNFAKSNKAWKPCGVNRYDVAVTRANFLRAGERGMAPEVVAGAIERALTGRWPRARYVVSRHALLFAAGARLAPAALIDAAILHLRWPVKRGRS